MFPTNVLIIQFVLFIMPERLGTILSKIFPEKKIVEATFLEGTVLVMTVIATL